MQHDKERERETFNSAASGAKFSISTAPAPDQISRVTVSHNQRLLHTFHEFQMKFFDNRSRFQYIPVHTLHAAS